MKVSDLYNRFKNETVYIIGTGPSLRLFPVKFLSSNLTIGLNQAYKYLPCTWNITIHPELINDDWVERGDIWITKKKHPMPPEPHEEIYWFENNKDIFDYSYLYPGKVDVLYVGHGIQTGALSLAAKMGFKNIFMVGCDMCSLGREHHFHPQNIQFHGLSPQEVYNEYYANTAMVRFKIKEKFKVNIFTLSPFLGLGHENRDYRRLKKEYDLPDIPNPKDVSEYQRKRPDFV